MARDIHLGVRGQGQVVGTVLEELPTPQELTWPPARQPSMGRRCVLEVQVPGRDLQKPEPTLSHRRDGHSTHTLQVGTASPVPQGGGHWAADPPSPQDL